MSKRRIYIGADHAGLELKNILVKYFASDFEWVDLGTNTADSVDYPDFADLVSKNIKSDSDTGILVCGSGQGMSIRANKYKHIRAALCWSEEIASLSRAHNNANVLCLGARTVTKELAIQITQKFLNTPFEGGRHARRVEKLSC